MPHLNRLPWQKAEEYFRTNDTVLFGVGCLHAHDHIPLGIDHLAAEYISSEVEKRTGLLVVPALPFGWMPQYMEYPGTVDVTSNTLVNLLLEVASSLHKWGVRKILFINGHGGNTFYLKEVAIRLREKGMLCPIFNWWELIKLIDPPLAKQTATVPPHDDPRICKTRGTETAVAMALAPEAMSPESLRIIYAKQLFGDEFKVDFFNGVVFRGVNVPMPMWTRETAEYGELGTNATPNLGQKILDEVVEFIAAFAKEFIKCPVPALPVYADGDGHVS